MEIYSNILHTHDVLRGFEIMPCAMGRPMAIGKDWI